ncbi:MAG: hypothetical protein K0Q77_832 [Anaerosporomusa subterranea]|jgi:hypothetical protein|nr:hypothetical protein [Anaerosporomusa subterranea]
MIKITKCHVCGSDRVVPDVKSIADYERNLPVRLLSDGIVKIAFFNMKAIEKTPVYAAVCRDCGTVRFYVKNGDKDWIQSDSPDNK